MSSGCQAILSQWENEQLNGHAPLPRSYWASNQPLLDHHVTGEMMKPKLRGCLKHVSPHVDMHMHVHVFTHAYTCTIFSNVYCLLPQRWLKHYKETCHGSEEPEITGQEDRAGPSPSEAVGGSDKENRQGQHIRRELEGGW